MVVTTILVGAGVAKTTSSVGPAVGAYVSTKDGEPVGVSDGASVATTTVGLTLFVGDTVGKSVSVGPCDGKDVVKDGSAVGQVVSCKLITPVGTILGFLDGKSVGSVMGTSDGATPTLVDTLVGLPVTMTISSVGTIVGSDTLVGYSVGASNLTVGVTFAVGNSVGVGNIVGFSDGIGDEVGVLLFVGTTDGSIEGAAVSMMTILLGEELEINSSVGAAVGLVDGSTTAKGARVGFSVGILVVTFTIIDRETLGC